MMEKPVISPDTYQTAPNQAHPPSNRKEVEPLAHHPKHKGHVQSSMQRLTEVWGYAISGDTRIVDVNISRLREKIESNTKEPLYIKTVHGLGYKMEPPVS